MPDDPRMLRILERLAERTRVQQQEWQPSLRSDYRFYTDVGDWYVAIESEDDDGAFPFRLTINDGEHHEIDVLRSTPLPKDLSDSNREEVRRRNVALKELYGAARRSALKVDATLDAVEQLLE